MFVYLEVPVYTGGFDLLGRNDPSIQGVEVFAGWVDPAPEPAAFRFFDCGAVAVAVTLTLILY